MPNTPPGPAGRATGDDVRVAGAAPARPAPPSELEDTAPDRPTGAPGEPVTAPDRPAAGADRAAAEPDLTAAEDQAARNQAARPAAPPPPPEPAADRTTDQGADRLLTAAAADAFRLRLRGIQGDFVDDPATAVREADDLAAEIVNAVGQALADRKRALEESGRGRGEGSPDGAPETAPGTAPDTERLRLALHDYRDFVNRLLGL
ncbi:hypothetical protein [Actinomadura rugatobispora]|uniref:Uncharacterized protein n=1 Tax=Actinomadura rugatobispora TaxID=1994 RepID=A0ABW1AES3_9ACTN|nr:hypothetical protein GCM10010200_105310 [Actinomadura rugatobispora]